MNLKNGNKNNRNCWVCAKKIETNYAPMYKNVLSLIKS